MTHQRKPLRDADDRDEELLGHQLRRGKLDLAFARVVRQHAFDLANAAVPVSGDEEFGQIGESRRSGNEQSLQSERVRL